MKMNGLDESLKVSGKSDIQWAGDKWYLLVQETASMQEMGDFKSMGNWSYDAKAKKFRSNSVDSMGTTMNGTCWTDAGSGVFHFRAESHNAMGTTQAKGTVTFSDADTMKWEWSEAAMGGLMPVVEITGTTKRVK